MLAGCMVMHVCQIGPTDTVPPCPGSPLWACIETRGETVIGLHKVVKSRKHISPSLNLSASVRSLSTIQFNDVQRQVMY